MMDQKAEQLRTEKQQAETEVYSSRSNLSQHERKAPKTARDWLEACTRDLVFSKEHNVDSDIGLLKQNTLHTSLMQSADTFDNAVNSAKSVTSANATKATTSTNAAYARDAEDTESAVYAVTADQVAQSGHAAHSSLGCLASADENLGQLNAAHVKPEQGKSTSKINTQKSFENCGSEKKQSQAILSDLSDTENHLAFPRASVAYGENVSPSSSAVATSQTSLSAVSTSQASSIAHTLTSNSVSGVGAALPDSCVSSRAGAAVNYGQTSQQQGSLYGVNGGASEAYMVAGEPYGQAGSYQPAFLTDPAMSNVVYQESSSQCCLGASNKLHQSNRAIRKAVIVSKVYHRPVGGAIVEIAKLLNNLGVEAYTDQSTAVGFNLDEVPILSRRGMKDCDLIIVVGGDGSLLGASRSLVDLQVPVLGINRGHLGLLTDISPNNLEDALTKVVKGNYTTETRMMIDVRVLRRDEEGSEELIGQSLALNETVIHSGILAHMIVCRVSINGRYMYTLRSDGIIVGTPTGSTAYSLSAGGPIIEPHLDVLCLVPMFPQSLNCSPIILPGKSKVEIEFEIKDSMPEWVNVNCDGQVTIRADTKCLVKIRQHANPLHLIHPAGYDYYSVLRQKLGWGQSLVN